MAHGREARGKEPSASKTPVRKTNARSAFVGVLVLVRCGHPSGTDVETTTRRGAGLRPGFAGKARPHDLRGKRADAAGSKALGAAPVRARFRDTDATQVRQESQAAPKGAVPARLRSHRFVREPVGPGGS